MNQSGIFAVVFQKGGVLLSRFCWVGLLLGGCSGETDYPRASAQPTFELEGIRYYAQEDDGFVCEEALPQILKHRDAFSEFMGLADSEVPSNVDYLKYRDQQELGEHADCEFTHGCYRNGQLATYYPVHYHELIHAWSVPSLSGSGALVEGLAAALSCTPSVTRFEPADSLSVGQEGQDIRVYGASFGALSLELLRRGTYEEFVLADAWFSMGGQTEESLAAALERVYGASTEEIWEAAKRWEAPTCLPLGRCDAPPLQPGPQRIEWTCTGLSERLVSSDLGRAVGLTAGPVPLALYSCELEPNEFPGRLTGLGEDTSRPNIAIENVMLTPSVPHLLTLQRNFVLPEGHVNARILSQAFLTQCPGDDEVLDWGVAPVMRFVFPSVEGTWWMRFGTDPNKEVIAYLSGVPEDAGMRAYLCEACSDSPELDCERIIPGAPAPAPTEGEFFVVLQSDGELLAGAALNVERIWK